MPKDNAKPYLRVANVFKEKIILDDISYLEATDEESLKYALRVDDLLVVEGHANIREIGRCAIVTEGAAGLLFQNHLFRLNSQTISSFFGMYFLNSIYARKYWEQNCSTSSGLNTINRTMLGNMFICVPDIDEQLNIELKLNTAKYFIERESINLTKLVKQKSGLMHDLLTGKVQVKVEAEEPEAVHV